VSVNHVLRGLDRREPPRLVQVSPQKASQIRPLFCGEPVEIVSTISGQTGVVLTVSSPLGGKIERYGTHSIERQFSQPAALFPSRITRGAPRRRTNRSTVPSQSRLKSIHRSEDRQSEVLTHRRGDPNLEFSEHKDQSPSRADYSCAKENIKLNSHLLTIKGNHSTPSEIEWLTISHMIRPYPSISKCS
jgi:hypothetical protein